MTADTNRAGGSPMPDEVRRARVLLYVIGAINVPIGLVVLASHGRQFSVEG